ncbi:hypothetical protein GLOIN_2v1785936 [Rhizophagus irregularis DAOM 181602=DAOM 197198]|nr:hypothetical protein GLOIN_2v1785936 [Rhizophagus irregularis DAOM 181602=DAOM 197198]
MVRRHSFNRRARQDLRESIEGQGEGTNVKSKVYDLVPSFHLVYHVGLDLVGIADVKNTRDIDDVLSFTDHTLANISREPHPLV